MNAVEFETVVTDGRIEIPAEHAAQVRGSVRVVLHFEPESTEDVGFFDELMDNPIFVPGFVPLTREQAHERR